MMAAADDGQSGFAPADCLPHEADADDTEPKLSRHQIQDALERLVAAERACARISAESILETDHPGYLTLFERSGRCAARHVTMLQSWIACERIGLAYGKDMAIADLGERATILHEAEAQLLRQLGWLLPRVADPALQDALMTMRDRRITLRDIPSFPYG